MTTNINGLCPEIIMVCGALVVMLMGLARNDAIRRATLGVAVASLVLAFIAALRIGGIGTAAGWTLWPLATYDTLLTCGIGILTVLTSAGMPFAFEPGNPDKHYRGEYFALLLTSLAGVSMIGKTTNLIWLFLALELVSIPTYVMVATGRSNAPAQEAGIKYFFLGALSAAIYLFGFSYLYGFAGSTSYVAITAAFHAALLTGHLPYVAIIGLIMVVIGIAYKIAAVPLHYYAPDVYQGAATPVTTFLSFAPKAAGFFALIMVLNLTGWRLSGGAARAVPDLLMVLAVLTMFVGNVLALLQRNIKRIFAYSSISHTGYMLVGLAVGPFAAGNSPASGISATLFYLGGYSIMTVGAFAALTWLQGKADAAEDLDDIAGIAGEHPFMAACMAICLFSLIGMPGTIGFLGKLFIVQSALAGGHPVLAILVVVNAAIAAAYYLRIIGAMYIREPWSPFVVRNSTTLKAGALIAAVLTIFLGIFPAILFNQSNGSAEAVRNIILNPVAPVATVKNPHARPVPAVIAKPYPLAAPTAAALAQP